MTHEQDSSATSERGARSQRSLLLERDLRLRNQKYADAIAETQSRIQSLEAERARLTQRLIDRDDRWTRTQFNDATMEVENARNLVAACEERIAANDVAIQGLSPSPEQLLARAEQQQRFSRLASDRLERDRQAYQLIGQLRRILAERGEMTDQMREFAGALDLTVANGEFDEFRFDALSDALPPDQSEECARWHGWFLAQRPDERPVANTYVVRDEHLTIRETLTDHGVYVLGDSIDLCEEEARELLREDRPPAMSAAANPSGNTVGNPIGQEDAPWRVAPPSIMTTAAYEEAARTAQEEGLTVREVLLRQNIDRELRAREAYIAVEEAMGARSRE